MVKVLRLDMGVLVCLPLLSMERGGMIVLVLVDRLDLLDGIMALGAGADVI
jgi:hypothetical protein